MRIALTHLGQGPTIPAPVSPRRVAILILGALAALRLFHWGAPLTEDEAYMVRTYANQPISGIATSFEAPNNHILLAMLLHLINVVSPRELFVSMAHPGTLQAVSILASIGAVVLLYMLVEDAYSARTALLAAAALGLSYWHLIYSHQLRGYSLSTFLLVLTVRLLHEGLVRERRRLLFFFPLAFAAFSYTVASNLYFSLGLGLALVVWLHRSPDRHPHRNALLGMLALGVVLTAILHLPIFSAMREASRQGQPLGAQTPILLDRLAFAAEVLGTSTPHRLYVLAFAVLGLAVGLGLPHRKSLLPIISTAMIAAPLAATTAQGIVIPFARSFVPLLPFWALAFALGLEAAYEFLAKRVTALRAAGPVVLTAMAVLPSLGDVREHLRWNRGLDVRALMADVVVRTRHVDDFVLIHPAAGLARFGGRVDWEYYAFAAGLPPQLRTATGQDAGYLLRKQYFIAAESEAEARSALERSRIDPVFARRLRPLARHGTLLLFGLAMDDALLREYKSISHDGSADPALRAQALTGLAFILLDSDRLQEAAALLEKAKELAPQDNRVRFHLGLTRHLALDDRKAAEEFAWLASHDAGNARAPLYYGDALAAQGRSEEALREYAWYDDPKNKANAGAWLFGNRARMAAESVRRGDSPPPPGKDGDGWARAARAFGERGSLERAAVAWRSAMRLKPTAEVWLGLAQTHIGLQENAAAEQILKRILATGALQENRVALAKVLYEKRSLAEAGRELESFIAAHPAHEEGRKLLRKIRRS